MLIQCKTAYYPSVSLQVHQKNLDGSCGSRERSCVMSPPVMAMTPPVAPLQPPVTAVTPPETAVTPPVTTVTPVTAVTSPVTTVTHHVRAVTPPVTAVTAGRQTSAAVCPGRYRRVSWRRGQESASGETPLGSTVSTETSPVTPSTLAAANGWRR